MLFSFHHVSRNFPNLFDIQNSPYVARVSLLYSARDFDVCENDLTVQFREVLVALDFVIFNQRGEHDDRLNVVLQYHSPEIMRGIRFWALSRDVLLCVVIALTR